jgi:putative phage-type endonuclease
MTARSAGSLDAEIVNRLAEKQGRPMPFAEQHPVTSRTDWLKLRRQDITASGAAALLGVHPYTTAFALWAEKTGAIAQDDEITEAMERGIELEPIAVKRLRKLHPNWIVEQPNCYYRDPVARLGATPDCFATDPEREGFGVVQIKSVEPMKFRKEWRAEDGVTEPPLWIVVQAIIEAHLTGASWASVAALVISYGIELHLVEVPLHAGIIDRINGETAAFWRLIEEGRRPDPDYGRDAHLVERFFTGTGGDIPLDLAADNAIPTLLDERELLSGQKSEAEKRLKQIKAELLTKLKGHACGLAADGRLITTKRVDRKAYEVKASSYVDLRVKIPKEHAV